MIFYIQICSPYSYLCLFRGMILACLLSQPKLWEPSWDLILCDTHSQISQHQSITVEIKQLRTAHSVQFFKYFLWDWTRIQLPFLCFCIQWPLVHVSSKWFVFYSDISASEQPWEMLRTSKCKVLSIPLQVRQLRVVFLYAMGKGLFPSPYLFTLWDFFAEVCVGVSFILNEISLTL